MKSYTANKNPLEVTVNYTVSVRLTGGGSYTTYTGSADVTFPISL